MVDWIYTNIKEGSTVLELGSGNGTAELVKKYKVYSVEEDIHWMHKVKESNYIWAPIENGWYDISFIDKIKKDYDVLLIDGPAHGEREGILKYINSFYNGSLIIMDDIERTKDFRCMEKLCELLHKNYTIYSGSKPFGVIK